MNGIRSGGVQASRAFRPGQWYGLRSRKPCDSLITQIFAGRCRIIVIHRELPRINAIEDSPSPGLQDRNLCDLHRVLLPRKYLHCAAWPSAFLCSASTFTPMAQMNPNSSRPIAVITFPLFFAARHELSTAPCNLTHLFQFRDTLVRISPLRDLQRLLYVDELGT